MNKLFFIFLSISSYLYSFSCNLHILGLEKTSNYKNISNENMLQWSMSKDNWSVSKLINNKKIDELECNAQSYVLVNDNKVLKNSVEYKKNSYVLKKGWNHLHSYIDGVDIVESFKNNDDVEFVYTYEPITKAWAGYSPDKNIRNTMYKTRILKLKSIEKDIPFYVYSKRNTTINIETIDINEACKKIFKNSNYLSLIDSGIENAFKSNNEKSMYVKSRYFSHHKRGVYSDSRVLFMYPDLKHTRSTLKKYGIAVPNIRIKYPKEYEGKNFYVYQFNEKKCYKGIFPSDLIPPYPALKEVK